MPFDLMCYSLNLIHHFANGRCKKPYAEHAQTDMLYTSLGVAHIISGLCQVLCCRVYRGNLLPRAKGYAVGRGSPPPRGSLKGEGLKMEAEGGEGGEQERNEGGRGGGVERRLMAGDRERGKGGGGGEGEGDTLRAREGTALISTSQGR